MSRLCGLVPVVCLILLPEVVSAQTGPQRRTLVTQSVNEAQLVPLRGNTRPEAKPANDRGPVPDGFPMRHLLLQLKRSPEQQQALEQFLAGLNDSKSSSYHKWITAQEFGARYGLSDEDLATVTNWLQNYGFSIDVVYPNRVTIAFSGTAAQVRRAFHTQIHYLNAHGARHIANMSNPQIPAALEPVIAGVVSLNDFKPKKMLAQQPNFTISADFQLVVPDDLATIYNFSPVFNSGYSGQGQTIMLLEDSNLYSPGDWMVFRKVFGLAKRFPNGSISEVHPTSDVFPCVDPGVNGDDVEAIVDAEWATAAAPNANIVMASCDDTFDFGGFIAMRNVLNGPGFPPAIISISYGASEADWGAAGNAAILDLYAQAVAEGVSVFVSSGDMGADSELADQNAPAAHGINVSAFASTPYNVAVGGTDFQDTYFMNNGLYWSGRNSRTYGSARSYIPEIPWNSSCANQLAATYLGFPATFGPDSFCNSPLGANFAAAVAGGGGPSGCANGTPAIPGVVGGTCAGYAKPWWQSMAPGNPEDGVRDLPDVALFASNGVWGHAYSICYSDPANGGAPCLSTPDNWSAIGGTSVSAPIMAALQALINQRTGERWGNPDPIYYLLANLQFSLDSGGACDASLGNGVAIFCMFHDVTQGDIDIPCTAGSPNCYRPSGALGVLSTSTSSFAPAYNANFGWDYATGLGSVNAYNLFVNWPSF